MDNTFCELKQIYTRLYRQFLEPVCDAHNLTKAELDVLLFLANNPQYDTATDIVEVRGITKSHVSEAVAKLEKRGFLERYCKEGKRRTIHLLISDGAKGIVKEAQQVQLAFFNALYTGVSQEEMQTMKRIMEKITKNALDAFEK